MKVLRDEFRAWQRRGTNMYVYKSNSLWVLRKRRRSYELMNAIRISIVWHPVQQSIQMAWVFVFFAIQLHIERSIRDRILFSRTFQLRKKGEMSAHLNLSHVDSESGAFRNWKCARFPVSTKQTEIPWTQTNESISLERRKLNWW